LGAGKTAFTKGVVRFFDDKITVTSPTFSLINSYPTLPTIHHFDLYRVKDENDLVDLGIFEYVDAESILIVEWAEKWRRNRPEKYFDVSISIVNEEKRQIVIETRCDDRTGS
jgi:tRNA threonylcarbamoyladenosine biosynthesis protein TsaE